MCCWLWCQDAHPLAKLAVWVSDSEQKEEAATGMKPPRKTTTFLIYFFILNEQKRGVIELLIRRTDFVLNVIDALSLRVKLYGFD